MLEAKNSGSALTNTNYQFLLALKPRQVLLAERNTKVTTMEQCNSKTLTLNTEKKTLLLQSVLGYLERNGFYRALKRLLSEAQIETNNWKACSLNLEDMYDNYMGTCTRAETNLDTFKDQELLTDGTNKKFGDRHSSAIEQTVGNKKKKESNKGENNAVENLSVHEFSESSKNSMEILAEVSLTNSTVGLNKKKKSKRVSDSLQQTEQLSTQTLKEPTADTVSELQIDESNNNQKDKKKKKRKSISKSRYANVERVPLDSIQTVTEEKVGSESEVKYKDKKKKHNPSTNSIGDNVEHFGLVDKKGSSTDEPGGNVGQSETLLVAIEDKSKDDNKFDSDVEGKSKDKTLMKKKRSKESPIGIVEHRSTALEKMHDFFLQEKKVESKETKRKKEGSVSDTLSGDLPNKEDPITMESKNGSLQTLGNANEKEKKSSKKRKRLASEENDVRLVGKLESEESKRRKIGNLEETKVCEQITQVNANAGDNKHAGTESKRENGAVTQYELQSASIKQTEANGNFKKDGKKSGAQKTRRKQHEGSAEPKIVNAFQRVKIDEVNFADERLQDNSYWAKDGAEVGYGAKAQEILGQVRGRDFRHEKTKKKRGSYRGGQIDLQAHSVKFNYSDEY